MTRQRVDREEIERKAKDWGEEFLREVQKKGVKRVAEEALQKLAKLNGISVEKMWDILDDCSRAGLGELKREEERQLRAFAKLNKISVCRARHLSMCRHTPCYHIT